MKTRNIIIAIALLSSCSGNTSHEAGGEDTTAVAAKDVMDLDDVTSEESLNAKYKDVLTRVKHIYSVWFNNDDYDDSVFSKEHNAISEEGCRLAEGCWGAECVFWTLTQDYGNNIKLNSATIHEVKNDTAVVVKCDIDLDLEDCHNHIVYLTMIKEDGKWVADDCRNDEFSYKECNLESIKAMKGEN